MIGHFRLGTFSKFSLSQTPQCTKVALKFQEKMKNVCGQQCPLDTYDDCNAIDLLEFDFVRRAFRPLGAQVL